MSVQETNLKAIADAIREKDGSTEPIPASTFPERIRAIPAGGLPEDVFTIAAEADPPEGGEIFGTGVASDGMTVILQASPFAGYKFNKWLKGSSEVGTEQSYSFRVDENTALTAEFLEVLLDWQLMTPYSSFVSIAYGKGVFVAVTNYDNKVYYSTDFETWNTASLPSSYLINRIKYVGDYFVILAGRNYLYSTDGKQWVQSSHGLSSSYSTFADVAYGNGVYVFTLESGNTAVFTSSITSSFKYLKMPINTNWYNIIYVQLPGYVGTFVAAGYNERTVAYLSVSASTATNTVFSSVTLPIKGYCNMCFVSDDKVIVTSTANEIAYSPNGWNNYKVLTLPEGVSGGVGCYGNGKYVLLNNMHTGAISTDGLLWKATAIPQNYVDQLIYADGKFISTAVMTQNAYYAISSES